MADDIVLPEDVKSRFLGGDIPATDTELATFIGDALDAIERDIPTLWDKIETNEIPIRRVKRIVSRIVIRHIRNPEGLRSTNHGTGPFTEGQTWAGESPGEIEVTDEDLNDLVPGYGGQQAYSVDLMPEGAGNASFPW